MSEGVDRRAGEPAAAGEAALAQASLNPSQREAVESGDGALLILAGPGSGKTRVIAYRVAHLVGARRIPPERILAVTFTNKAAREMRERVESLIGPRAHSLTLGTFHAVCARILRRRGSLVGVPPDFQIYDTDDQRALVRRIESELQIDPRQFAPGAVLATISGAKNRLTGPDAYARSVGDYFEEIVARVYQHYEQALRGAGAVDFDDLLLLVVQLFDVDPMARDDYAERYLHVLVDEFQDTNLVQYRLARQLASVHGNITVVGDPDQAIYSWRAADARNLQHFTRDFPSARRVLLEQNYRSTGRILRVARSVLAGDSERPDKGLWTENPEGDRVALWDLPDDEEEGRAIGMEVRRLLDDEGRPASEIAVMYRTNAQSRAVEEALIEGGVPYRIVGGTRFYDRREVRDLLAYLRLAHNGSDVMAFRRIANVPARGIGGRSVDAVVAAAAALGVPLLEAASRLGAGEVLAGLPPVRADIRRALQGFAETMETLGRAAAELPVSDLLETILSLTRYREELERIEEGEPERVEARWENVQELLAVAARYAELEPDASLASFLEDVALVADVDDPASDVPDAVTLTTLHAAKGLEYEVVFLAGLEEGLLPHSRSLDDPHELAEERRLLYVGVTRAKERLYLTHAQRRRRNGLYRPSTLCRWVQALPGSDLARPSRRRRGAASGRTGRAAARAGAVERRAASPGAAGGAEGAVAAADPPAFAPGDRVEHRVFGEGVVVSCEALPGDQQVTVAFDGKGVRRLLVSYAPLSRL